MIAVLAAAFVFLALSCMALALFRWSADQRPAERRLRQFQQEQRGQGGSRQAMPLRRGPSSIPALRDRLANSAWAERSAVDLARAGLTLRVG